MIALTKDLYNKACEFLFTNNPYTWVYGIARTTLAIGTLITLLFSSNYVLFDYEMYHAIKTDTFYRSINLFVIMGWSNLVFAKVIAIFILILVCTGYYPRITGIFHWWVALSFFHASSIIEGGDQINAILTFLLVPITLLDSRKSHWGLEKNPSRNKRYVGNLMLVLMAIQMAMIYLNAVVEKMYTQTEEWKLGNAFYYYANDSYFGYSDWMNPLMETLLSNSFIVSSITWGTLLLELLLFGVLFSSKKIKLAIFPLGVLFHFMIIVFFGLFSFFFAMLGGLILYLIPSYLPKEIAFKWLKKSNT